MVSLIVTTFITVLWSKLVSVSATLGDSLRSSMLSLIAVGLITVMTYQIVIKQLLSKQSPLPMLLAWPILTFIVTATIARHRFSVPFGQAALLSVVNGLALYLLLQTGPFWQMLALFAGLKGR
jgi:hypothetical protein